MDKFDFDAIVKNNKEVLEAITLAQQERPYTEQEELFLSLLESENDSHLALSRIYTKLNPQLFACFGDDKNTSYYYQDAKSGRLLKDDSKKVFISGIDKMTAILDAVIQEKQRTQKKDDMAKLKRFRKQLGQKQFMKSIHELIASEYWVEELYEKLDAKTHLVGFDDGVYDLETSTFRKARYSEYVSKTCGYPYPKLEKKGYNRVKETIRTMFKSEDDFKAILFQLAYLLDGNKRFETIHIWTGVGGNGKTVLMRMIEKAFGEYFAQLSSGYFTNYDDKSNAACPELVALRGVRVANTDEMGADSKVLIHKMKRLTTNISGRNLFEKKIISFMPQFANIIQANDMPALSNVDDAIARRLKISRFPFLFRDENPLGNPDIKPCDRTLMKDIDDKELYKQFMILLLESYKADVKDAKVFYQSKSSKEETEEFLELCNPVATWFKEYYEITNSADDRVGATQLYQEFKRATNRDMTATQFGRYISSMGIQKKRANGIVYTNVKEKVTKDEHDD